MENFNAKDEALHIVEEHVAAYMMGCIAEVETETELCELMAQECAYILVQKRLNGDYTPLEFNKVRNEITNLLSLITQTQQ